MRTSHGSILLGSAFALCPVRAASHMTGGSRVSRVTTRPHTVANFRNGAYRNGGSGGEKNGDRAKKPSSSSSSSPSPSSSPASSSSPPAAGRGRAEGKRLTLGGGEPSDNPETTPLFDTYADDGRVFGDADLILPLDISPHASPVLDAPGGYSFDVGKGVTRWPAFLSTSWEFDENLAMAKGAMAPLLAAPWRLMLLSDGSVTRHLQLLTDAKVTVDVLSHDAVRLADIELDSSVPADVFKTLASFTPATGNHPEGNTNNVNTDANGEHGADTYLLHREVDLCDGRDGTPLVYASSWWTLDAAERFGILELDGGATERAVWMHLSERRTELFREVKRMYHGHSPVLEDAWALSGPFWGRHYVFWAGEVPLCVIYEVFSPALERFLGDAEGGTWTFADSLRAETRKKEEAA